MLFEKALAMQEVGHFQQGLVGVDRCRVYLCQLQLHAFWRTLPINIELQL